MTTITAPPFAGLRARLRTLLTPTPRVSTADALAAYYRAVIADANARLDHLERELDALREDRNR